MMTELTLPCYQCGTECAYLLPDGRCESCTSWTPEELRGERSRDAELTDDDED